MEVTREMSADLPCTDKTLETYKVIMIRFFSRHLLQYPRGFFILNKKKRTFRLYGFLGHIFHSAMPIKASVWKILFYCRISAFDVTFAQEAPWVTGTIRIYCNNQSRIGSWKNRLPDSLSQIFVVKHANFPNFYQGLNEILFPLFKRYPSL